VSIQNVQDSIIEDRLFIDKINKNSAIYQSLHPDAEESAILPAT
jgi:hypothetical protein